MYKSKKKKLLSIFMAFALVLNLIDIPLIANASENEIVEVFNEGFSGNKNQIAAGEGWILEPSNMGGYDSQGNYGKESPSAKLDKSGRYIETPSFELETEGTLSFWIKGQNVSESYLSIKGLVNDQWTDLYVLKAEDGSLPNNVGQKVTYEIPRNVTKLRLEYTKVTSNVTIDDIVLTTVKIDEDEKGTIKISDARAAELGSSVKVKGIVTFKEASGNGYNYAIQDKSAGIAIRGTESLEIGDEVIVEGKTSEFKSLVQIQNESVVVKSKGNELPAPKEVTVADIINNNGGENYESQRVKFIGVNLGTINTSGNTVMTDTEGNSINIYKIPEGVTFTSDELVDVVGICSQHNNYQIMVVSTEDIVKSSLIIEDLEGPELKIVSPTATTTNAKPTIKVSYTDMTAVDLQTVKLYVDDIDVTAHSNVSETSVIYVPGEDLSVGTHTIKVEACDTLGFKSEVSGQFEVREKINTDELNVYFGQLHSHSTNSDGAGTVAEAYDYAKNVAGVDFLAVTDHSNSFDNCNDASMEDGSASDEWISSKALAESMTDEEFVAIYAFEMTWSNGIGHINTFNTPGFENRTKPEYKATEALQNYYNKLKEFSQSISQLNHPGDTFGDFNDFSHYDEEIDAIVNMIEVGNGEGPVRGSGYFPSYEYYTRALDKGWHVAPTNNQDNHKGRWGNANTTKSVILAESLTEESIYDAMRNLRVYATEDENLSIKYTLNNEIMGTVLNEKPEEVNIKIEISDEDAENIGTVSVIANGGKVVDSKKLDSNKGTVEFNLSPDYSYYFIRVDQEDKDIAVTAPVWIDEVEKAGIAQTTTSTTMPIKGEEFAITSNFFNNESSDLEVTNITYSIGGKVVHETSNSFKVDSLGTANYTFDYTHGKAGNFNIDVKATAVINGVEKIYTDVLKIDVKDPSVVSRVVVDGTHFNDYVSGYYANNLGNFTTIANKENIAVNIETEKITDEMLENTDLLVISAPAKKSSNANGISYQPQEFSEEFIEMVKRYTDNGGSLIICGIADYQDGTGVYATSTQLNKLLAGIGATSRINNDEVVDDDNKVNSQNFRLAFTNFNMENKFLAGVVDGQKYSFYNGCSVSLDEKAVEEGKATWLVKGHDTTYSIDSNKNTPGTSVAKGDVVALGMEKLNGGGNMFIGGTIFISDFEVQASLDNYNDLQYTNYNIALNILDSIKREINVSPIKEAHNGELGDFYCVEGYVTAGTQAGNAFFDTIYIQDSTGGINIFPVAGIDLKLGQKVRVTGLVSEYEGEKEIDLETIELIDESINLVDPTKLSTGDAAKKENEGLLISVTGKVVEIGENNKEYMILNDGSGDIRIFLNGYVGASDGSLNVGEFSSDIKVGDTVTAIGLGSTDPLGARLRVRDSIEVKKVEEVVSNEAVNKVIELIEAIPEEVTLECKAQVSEARKAYDVLTAEEKALVTNYEKLTKAEAEIKKLEDANIGEDNNDHNTGNGSGNNTVGGNTQNGSPNNGSGSITVNGQNGQNVNNGDNPSVSIPVTGGTDTTFVCLFGLLIISAGIIIVAKNRKKEA